MLKLRWAILGTLLLLCFFAALSFNKSGETLATLKGEVTKCAVLSGATTQPIFHATIKDEKGNYVIASLKHCKPQAEVTILIKRGAVYFNTVYAAENNPTEGDL